MKMDVSKTYGYVSMLWWNDETKVKHIYVKFYSHKNVAIFIKINQRLGHRYKARKSDIQQCDKN